MGENRCLLTPPSVYRLSNNFDNDSFQIMKNNTGGLGGGRSPQKIFAILQSKILLTSQKKMLTNKGGQNECKNLAEYNCT